jgi:hypothetical protein
MQTVFPVVCALMSLHVAIAAASFCCRFAALPAPSSAAGLLLSGVDVINYSVRMLRTVCSHTRSSASLCRSFVQPCRWMFLFKQAYRIAAQSHVDGSSADACQACCPEMRLHTIIKLLTAACFVCWHATDWIFPRGDAQRQPLPGLHAGSPCRRAVCCISWQCS